MKHKIDLLLHENKAVIKFIYGLIILNVVCLILESYEELNAKYGSIFQLIEMASVIIFTIEYLLRLWVAKKRFKFVLSPLGLIDLFAILPFYLPMLFTIDFRVLRILRLFRLVRIFKLGRFSKSLKTISEVLKETRTDLAITLFIASIFLILSSTLMYHVEHDVQPEKFATIGHSFWWAVATLTTVGYGDVYPMTAMGKFLSAIIALIGIGFVALPAGIIASEFVEKVQIKKAKKNNGQCECPNCGTKFRI